MDEILFSVKLANEILASGCFVCYNCTDGKKLRCRCRCIETSQIQAQHTHSVCMDGACERVKHTCIRTWNNKIFSTLTAPLYMATQIGNRVNKQWYFFYTLNSTTHTRSASSVAYENCIHSLVCLLQTLRSHTYFVRHSTMLVVIVFRFHQFSACVFLLSFAFVFAVCFCFCFVRTPTIHNWMTSVRIMHGIMTICCLKLHR